MTDAEPLSLSGRRPTINDVARRAGVSRATASLVIREAPGPSAATRERVERAVAELGYEPSATAQLLRRSRSRLIGVVFTTHDPFHGDLLEHLYAASEGTGYDIVLSAVTSRRREGAAIATLMSSRVEALVLLGARRVQGGLDGLASRLPIVDLGGDRGASLVDSVHTAEDRGVVEAVDHLVALGHRRIAHVDGGDLPGAAARRRGYLEAMRAHRLDAEARVIPGDYTEVSGAEAVDRLLSRTPGRHKAAGLPTAIVAGNDRCAAGVLDAARQRGIRVPDELSIVGFDDSQLARLAHVDLTTIRQDATGLAAAAIECAIERVEGVRRETLDIGLEPTLVVRGTTGPAPAR